MQKQIDYIARDFSSIRTQLIEYTKKHFPNTYTDFNDASIGMLLIELKYSGWKICYHSIQIGQFKKQY